MTDGMIGRTLGHYTIVAHIGAGAMGNVYRALDAHLHCDVAIKILHADALGDASSRKRFRQEANALARRAHPNLVTIHDFDTEGDTDFIVMEYVEGKTVADMVRGGGLNESSVKALGYQLAKGMNAAHRSGMIHRDLKPLNLMVSPEGDLKIVDFGLAKFITDDTPAFTTAITDEGSVVGTLPYMAPELFLGSRADVRSDIYSAGVVLYEMATGRRPHEGATKEDIIQGALTQTPAPPSRWNARVSPDTERIILKALDREPSRRYQTAADLQADMERVGSGRLAPSGRPPARVPTWLVLTSSVVAVAAIAWGMYAWLAGPTALLVLPLKNDSGDSAQDYFADGMTEELISSLGRIDRLPVISLSTAMTFKGKSSPAEKIRRKLNVRWLVEGTVVRDGPNVRISVELIDAPRNRHVWAEHYQREMSDALALQSEVSAAIAHEIDVHLPQANGSPAGSPATVEPAALDAYLRGRYLWNQRDPAQVEGAIKEYLAAVDADPGFAKPHAGLADAYGMLGNYSILPQAVAHAMAKEEARTALKLDPKLSDAHVSLAMVKMDFEYDWAGAEDEFRRAIVLSPGNVTAHQWRADLLSRLGRFSDAEREIREALKLDPLSPHVAGMLGTIYYYKREPDRAIEQYRHTLTLGPQQPLTHFYLGLALLEKNLTAEAVASFERAVQVSGGAALMRAGLGLGYARAGRREEANRILEELRSMRGAAFPPTCLALIAIGLDDKDSALDYIEEGWRSRDSYLGHLKVLPIVDGLRSDPRFTATLRRVGLDKR